MKCTEYFLKESNEIVSGRTIADVLPTDKFFRFVAVVVTVVVIFGNFSSSAFAAGVASNGKTLGGLTDRQCLQQVDRVVADEQRNADNLLQVVRGSFSRKLIYDDGSVDFSCTPNRVDITVFFNNAGNSRARADLQNFLAAF